MKTMRLTLYTTGVILAVLGIWSMTYPTATLLSLAFFLGIGFVLSGINHILPFFTLSKAESRPAWLLALGLADLLIGIIMLMKLGLTAFMIPIALAVWFCFTGIVRIWGAFAVKRLKLKGWWLILLNGLMMILLSALVFFSPFLGFLSVAILLGSALIFSGIMITYEAYYVFR